MSVLFDHSLPRFLLAGILNTLAGMVLMFGLYNIAGCGYWLSSVVSYISGSVLSFFLNKYFTFGVRQWSVFMVTAFIANITLCYVIAYGAAKPAMNYLLLNSPQSIRENTALFTGMCLFTGLNYLGQRYFVFNNRNKT